MIRAHVPLPRFRPITHQTAPLATLRTVTRLLLLFILVPAFELILLIQIGGMIGTLATIGIIVLTGALGASLARWQGLGVLRQMQLDLFEGRLPAGSMIDGAIILFAAALLLTPGFLTDAVGFLSLVPGFRLLVKRALWNRLEKAVREGRTNVFIQVGGPRN